MNWKATSKSQRGVTLFELLVVLGIVALVISVSLPLLSRKPDHISLRRVAMEVAAMLRTARSEAVTRNTETVFSLDVDTGDYWISGRRKKRLPPDLSRKLLSAGEEQVNETIGRFRFFPDGASSGGSLELSSGQLKQTLKVNWLTGTVTVE